MMKNLSIKEIAKRLEEDKCDELMIANLRMDERLGVKRMISKYDKHLQRKQKQEGNFQALQMFDNDYRKVENDYIAGVDEAGRGPLAGPVVAAAVILPKEFKLLGLTDSKQVSEENRNLFYDRITREAISYHIAIIDNHVIDQLNILGATKKAMTECLLGLPSLPEIALIDAVELGQLPFKTKAIIKGDEKSLAIAAASILAKVTRDRLMLEMDHEYPVYGFKQHKGYGTKEHMLALEKYGPTAYHRMSFTPVRESVVRKGDFQ